MDRTGQIRPGRGRVGARRESGTRGGGSPSRRPGAGAYGWEPGAGGREPGAHAGGSPEVWRREAGKYGGKTPEGLAGMENCHLFV